MTPTLEATLAQLEAMGNEKVRARNLRNGAEGEQYGVQLGDIRNLAAKIKANDELGMALWETGNLDARLLAILLIKPKLLPRDAVDRMVRSAAVPQLADWLSAYVLKHHPDKEALRLAWLEDDDPWAARAGWGMTSDCINSSPEGLDVPALLDRIEREMGCTSPFAPIWIDEMVRRQG